MDTKQEFIDVIKREYYRIVKGEINEELLHVLSETIADYYYEQYKKFGKQYPKSIKRYSSFQIKDLNHPTTFELIIKTLKDQVGTEYGKYAMLLLQKNPDELKEFEKNREDFYKMF